MATPIVELIPPDQLHPWARNARTHSRKQIRQIADSITRFGFTNPVLIDRENAILAGHGRVAAAKLLGMETVPCLCIENMSAAEKRAYVIADNKLALNAGWNEEMLAIELQELLAADIGFDIDITGFSIAEVDNLIEGLTPTEPGDPADEILPDPDPRTNPLPSGRYLAVGTTPAYLRRFSGSEGGGPADGSGEGRNGFHRSSL